MNAPLLIALGTLVSALLSGALRGRPRGAALASASGAAVLGAFALLVHLEQPFVAFGLSLKVGGTWGILGRFLVLGQGNRTAVGFLYLAAAFIFGGSWIARPGRYFHSVGFVSVGAVVASLMVRPFLFAAIFLEIAAMGSVLILAKPGQASRRGALRLLSLYTTAMLTTLLAGWRVEILGAAGGTPEEALQAAMFLAVGFAILMVVPPFHHWLPAEADTAHPYALAFVAVFLQSAGLFFLLRFLDGYPWLRDNVQLFAGMRTVGAVMVVAAASLAAAQPTLGRAVAYALIADLGLPLISVGTRTPQGYQLAVGLIAAHAISLAVCALGLTALEKRAREDPAAGLRGVGRRAPLAAAATVAGLLSLAGFPLTAGFPARWALLQSLAAIDLASALGIVAGIAIGGAAALRWLGVLLQEGEGAPVPLPIGERAFLAGGVFFCVLFGTFPQLFAGVFGVAQGFPNLIP